MFERFTERARRVLFFARYETSQLGGLTIDTEHILLGLIREGKGLTTRIFARAGVSLETIRHEIVRRSEIREKVSTSVEIPFSAGAKRALEFASEESDRLEHNYIGTEHLLLGLLREERGLAASILKEKGLQLDSVREDVVQLLNDKTTLTRSDVATRPKSVTENVSDRTAPSFVPSRVVHIAYSDYSPEQVAWIQRADPAWRAYGFTLAHIVAHAWDGDEEHVTIAEGVRPGRYDLMIVLPAGETVEAIPGLLREAIEQQLGVSVTREDGTLIVRSRERHP